MKQIIIYIILAIVAIGLVIVIQLNHEPEPDKAITVSQYYSVMDPFQGVDIPLYLSNDNHVLTQVDSYQTIYLVNDDASKKLSMMLENISIDGEETYLNDTYTRYMLELDLPVLNEDFFMSECSIDITLTNGLTFLFDIGTFSYLHVENSVNDMFWTSLEALKAPDVDIARIKEIAVCYDTLENEIDHVSIGINQTVDYRIENGVLTIVIEDDDLLLYGCPIAIYYTTNETQIIDYFSYLREHTILQSSGLLNHVYNVNYSN